GKAGKKRRRVWLSGDGEVLWESLPWRSGRPPHGPGAVREHLDRVLGLLRPHLDQPLHVTALQPVQVSLPFTISWHDKAMMFEHYHWKKNMKKNEPYQFKLSSPTKRCFTFNTSYDHSLARVPTILVQENRTLRSLHCSLPRMITRARKLLPSVLKPVIWRSTSLLLDCGKKMTLQTVMLFFLDLRLFNYGCQKRVLTEEANHVSLEVTFRIY
ncbi:hypothetical protein MUK42_31445, partial [Musa troglodytarum]